MVHFLNFLKNLARRPNPGIATFKVYFKISFFIALGVFLVLAVLQPFNLGNRNIFGNPHITAAIYALGSLATMLLNFVWVRLFPKAFSNERWTLGKDVLVRLFQMASIGLAIWLINDMRGVLSEKAPNFITTLREVLAVGSIPYLIVLFVRHIYLLKYRLQKATKINIGLMLNNKDARERNAFQQIRLKNHYSIDINSLVLAETKDGHLSLIINNNGNIENIAVETTLSEFEAENAHFEQLFRCHDQAIINKNRIIWVESNAAGFELILHPDLPAVRVSTDKTDEFRKQMNKSFYAN